MASVQQILDALDISAQKLGTQRIAGLCTKLGQPQNRYPVVHIAGTNGKGSVSVMVSACLQEAGYKVGCFTSPHLCSVRERIAINGQPIEEADFERQVLALHQRLLDWYGPKNEDWPSYFEFLTALGYQFFAQSQVDVALIEVGLGGRLDATNILETPSVTVITSIAYDHMEHLGDTLGAIAGEKAGILKSGCPLVLGPDLPDEARDRIYQEVEAVGAEPVMETSADHLYVEQSEPRQGQQCIRNLVSGERYRLGLLGLYQRNNLATALGVLELLKRKGFSLPEEALKQGLSKAQWPGRFQYFPEVQIIVDGSHNPHGLSAFSAALNQSFPDAGIYWLLSLRKNRDPAILKQLIESSPQPMAVLCTAPQSKPSLYHPPQQLRNYLRQQLQKLNHAPVWAASDPETALWMLQKLKQNHAASKTEALGVITGSLYTVGETLPLVDKVDSEPACRSFTNKTQ